MLRSSQVASKDASPTGLVHKSGSDRDLSAVEQVLCGVCFCFAGRQYGEVCVCLCVCVNFVYVRFEEA